MSVRSLMGVYNGKFVKFPGSRGKTAGNIDIYYIHWTERKSATRPPEILMYPSILSQRYVKLESFRVFGKIGQANESEITLYWSD